MPYFSKNPIIATASSFSDFAKIELEIFLEKFDVYDSYKSLGVFTLRADGNGSLSEPIETILDAGLIADFPNIYVPETTDPFLAFDVPGAVRKYYFRTREFNDGEWTTWVDSAINMVMYGGQPSHEFNNTWKDVESPKFLAWEFVAGGSVQVLMPSMQAKSYVFLPTADECTYTVIYQTLAGADYVAYTSTYTPPRANSVVTIPIFRPISNTFKSNFKLKVVVGPYDPVCDFFYNKNPVPKITFSFINSMGGISYIPCSASISKSIEISQSVYELPNKKSEVWKISGSKKHKVSTGFYESHLLEIAIQDFLLSPYKFLTDNISYNRPIIVETKNAEYMDDYKSELRSFTFEFRYLFEINQPSQI